MPASLFSLTFGEFMTMLNGKRKQDEAQNREQWEQTRAMTHILFSVHLKKGKRVKPSELMPFPWDKVTTAAPSQSEREKARERINKRDRKTAVDTKPLRITSAGKLV